MKSYSMKNLLALLLLTVATVGVYAQKQPAGWRLYQHGNSVATGGWVILADDGIEGMTLKSLKFTDKAYDTYVYTESKGVKDDGRWYMEVSGSGALSIAKVKVGIVPATYTDSEVEAKFQEGSLTDLREVDMNNYTTVEFIVEDGSYKPVAFGYDEQGTYRSFAVGLTETFTTAVDCNAVLYAGSGLNSYRPDDWGYGTLMHIRDIMGEEYATPDIGYNWYRTWAVNTSMGSGLVYSQIVWKTLDTAIGSLEDIIDMLQKRSQKAPIDKASYGTALAMRAMLYMDAARMYEFLDNDATSAVNAAGNNVSGLTYPIGSSAYHQKNNTATVKRATRSEIAAYILNDLNQAEETLTGATTSSKLQADLGVVYGLKARFYLWTEDYAQAKAYAEKAIAYGQHTPLTKEEWLSTTRGFNDKGMSSWMWAMNYPQDSYPVTTWIINWTSWCSNEYDGGYATYYATSMIGKSIYDRMSDTDFRKLSFKAPYSSALSGQEPYIAGGSYDYLPEYASLKFRPGQGEFYDALTACAVDVPLMRIEEMHFIRCEADAQLGNLEAAKQELTAIMQYRDANYTTSASDQQSLIDEIFLQKRIEFWGEGLNYFDYKRLNKPVTRNYDGTNFDYEMRFNTTTRPAWMNFVFVMNAYNGAIEDWNNPDPSDCYNIGTR